METQQTLEHYSAPKSSSVNHHRLWRPAAQRNIKNQWSRLNSLTQDWASSFSTARSHATSLVNAYLSQRHFLIHLLCITYTPIHYHIIFHCYRFMKHMDLGVLTDMPHIHNKACLKLFNQQVAHGDNLLSSYKQMVGTVVNMVNASMSLRCFLKGGTSSPLVQFSNTSNDANDNGDGGGIPVFIFYSVSSFEKLAWELVQMFKLELNLKRTLVIEFLSLGSKQDSIIKNLCWSDEIYEGEFDDLSRCNLDCSADSESAPTKLDCQPDSDVLQIYLTAWLTDVNLDKQRVEDIFSQVGEEMHVNFVS